MFVFFILLYQQSSYKVVPVQEWTSYLYLFLLGKIILYLRKKNIQGGGILQELHIFCVSTYSKHTDVYCLCFLLVIFMYLCLSLKNTSIQQKTMHCTKFCTYPQPEAFCSTLRQKLVQQNISVANVKTFLNLVWDSFCHLEFSPYYSGFHINILISLRST